MTTFEIVLAIIGLALPVIGALIIMVHKMHNGRVDALDKREADNYKSLLTAIAEERNARTEERRVMDERDNRIFEKMDKATEKMGELHASINGNFVSKDDCRRCKEA